MEIQNARFLVSSSKVEQCPANPIPEYAFIGRSNVGKSSLINYLTGIKKLAQVSSTPGKTKLINHFLVNEQWHLVDLPGYGYAKTSKKDRGIFSELIKSYIQNRDSLTLLFVLLDARLEPQKIDLEFLRYLGMEGIPFALIFTKADKIGLNQTHSQIANYKKTLSEEWEELPPIFLSSSEKKWGGAEILQYIDQINRTL